MQIPGLLFLVMATVSATRGVVQHHSRCADNDVAIYAAILGENIDHRATTPEIVIAEWEPPLATDAMTTGLDRQVATWLGIDSATSTLYRHCDPQVAQLASYLPALAQVVPAKLVLMHWADLQGIAPIGLSGPWQEQVPGSWLSLLTAFPDGPFAMLPFISGRDRVARNFHARFGGAGWLLNLSRVAYSSTGTEAVVTYDVTCWLRCGSGHVVLLALDGGSWRIVRDRQTWAE